MGSGDAAEQSIRTLLGDALFRCRSHGYEILDWPAPRIVQALRAARSKDGALRPNSNGMSMRHSLFSYGLIIYQELVSCEPPSRISAAPKNAP
jgi:hypothetical protein